MSSPVIGPRGTVRPWVKRVSNVQKLINPATLEISFLIGGGGQASGTMMFERVQRQMNLVKKRMGLEEMARIEMMLGRGGGDPPGTRPSDFCASDEAVLRRWRFILNGETVDPKTMDMLVILVVNAPRHRWGQEIRENPNACSSVVCCIWAVLRPVLWLDMVRARLLSRKVVKTRGSSSSCQVSWAGLSALLSSLRRARSFDPHMALAR
jgi:hypothetical protein